MIYPAVSGTILTQCSMKIFLFNSLNIIPSKYWFYPEQARAPFMKVPPLGLFSLSGSVRGLEGCETRIIDLNHEASEVQYPSEKFPEMLYLSVKEKYFSALERGERFMAGFQTLCNSHHFAVLLSGFLKRDFPECIILFGGAHASIVAGRTMEMFGHVDMVLCGEADITFAALVGSILRGGSLESVGGLCYRDEKGQVRTAKGPEIPLDLDLLPFPDYDSYPYPMELSYVEIGRGCPYRCAYCATSLFFSRICRYKPFDRIVRELEALKERTGTLENVNFVHDNFFGAKKASLDLCRHLPGVLDGTGLQWGCSARLDVLGDHETLSLLKDAGCRKIFIGIETASEDMQRRINKNVDLKGAHNVIEHLKDEGFEIICSFMCEFPDETPAQLESTLRLCAFCKLHNIMFQMNPLIILPGTQMYERYGAGLTFNPERSNSEYDRGFLVSENVREMLGRSPEVFSVFYSHPLEHPELKDISNLAEFLINFFVYTCLGIVFWSGPPVTIVDICLELKQYWGAPRRAFLEKFAEWIHDNYGHIGPVVEFFRFERDCRDAVFAVDPAAAAEAVPYSGEVQGRLFSDIRVVPGNYVKWGNYKITPHDVKDDFTNALRSGTVPEMKRGGENVFFVIKGEPERNKGFYRTSAACYPEAAGRLFTGLIDGESTVGGVLEASCGEMSLTESIQWVLHFFEKGYVNIKR